MCAETPLFDALAYGEKKSVKRVIEGHAQDRAGQPWTKVIGEKQEERQHRTRHNK